MSERQKRNVIIISLCGVLLLMVVGYAAFATQLNINGTTSISSNWDIKITSIKQNTKEGDASSLEGFPKYEDLSATFNVNLVSPGDYITYEIAVENKGNIDAEVARVKLSEPENDAIKFETNGIEEGEILTANGGTDILTVKVTYSDEVTSQPESLEASLTVTLDYVEKGKKSEWAPSDETTAQKLIKIVTTSGDGLYADEYEPNRYVYKGANPNNYITFNNTLYRIMAVESDGTLKIMANSSIGYQYWDTTSSYIWSSASLNTYLNGTFYNGVSENKGAIITHIWNAGGYNSSSLSSSMVSAEKETTVDAYVGLPTVSEYLRAGGSSSYMNKGVNYWLITINSSDTRYAWYVPNNGSPSTYGVYDWGNDGYPSFIEGGNFSIFPTLYLSSDVQLSGTGEQGEPFTITNYLE